MVPAGHPRIFNMQARTKIMYADGDLRFLRLALGLTALGFNPHHGMAGLGPANQWAMPRPLTCTCNDTWRREK
jgi:hypothetical protein